MSKAVSKRLGDLINLKRGYDLPENKRRPGPYPVISSAGVTGYHDEYMVEGEGVVTGRYGTLGEMYYVNGKYWPHNTALYITTFKGNYPKYVYYLLSCLGRIRTSDKSAVPGINRNELHEMAVPAIVDTTLQKKIAAVLSALDAKIDCNNRINAELEAMTKALYDYWFVQFEFPNADGNPYRSSGGKMTFNATLKREIPEVWCNSTIGSLISLEYGKGLKAENRTGSGYPVIGSNGVVGYHTDFLVKGPGIVVGRKGTVGAITFIHTDFFPIDTTYYVKPIAEIGFIYLKYLLSSLGLENMNSDSAVPGLNREAALRIPIASPPTSLIQDFEQKIAPIFKKMHISSQENQQLSKLREWLLPLLMNGQVSVV
ncbi:MAG: restriction endonuclease subunit S [Candidatus Accumulibacter sp.]|uniref:restriction endonuclease subunit S n=1 Tax=Accumulibacter sp. TaxID=2053492 RepID=UPI001AC9EB31|nr:restriction endonuclease subunit S [Accumulibacter sp.]MBN8517766.1 restriction endonuclease subunit S [Accumulibacter sp.]MBO3711058.1 restriction endonuclease subunit S [Accumulibacter sp.]